MIPINIALRNIRRIRKLNQTQLGNKAGMVRSNISRYETGTRVPTIETLQRFSIGLEVPVWRIVRYAEKLQAEVS